MYEYLLHEVALDLIVEIPTVKVETIVYVKETLKRIDRFTIMNFQPTAAGCEEIATSSLSLASSLSRDSGFTSSELIELNK